MSEATIEVERREETGKNANRRLRGRGLVPAVLYGAGREPIAIQLSRKTLLDLFKAGGHENRIFLLKLAGTDQSRHAMVRDLQLDALTSEVTHLDFQRIAMDQKLRVSVRIELDGVPAGVRNDGGVLDFVTRELEIECLPSAIPAVLRADVSEMGIGSHLEARELALPEGVAYLGAPDSVIASVKHSRVDAATTVAPAVAAEAAVETAEPELIQRGKKEEAEES